MTMWEGAINSTLSRYRSAVGGGHTSARLQETIRNKGLRAGMKEFFEICQVNAIMVMNEYGIPHSHIPEFTAMFTVANPLIAVLVSNPSTAAIGYGIAETPGLKEAWTGGTGNIVADEEGVHVFGKSTTVHTSHDGTGNPGSYKIDSVETHTGGLLGGVKSGFENKDHGKR